MTADDPLETAIRAGAVSALRRRAARQARIAQSRTTVGDRGSIVCDGEAVVAAILARAFAERALELEAEGGR